MFRLFKTNKPAVVSSIAVATTLAAAAGVYQSRQASSQVAPAIQPDGDPKKLSTRVLETGSKVLQSNAPFKDFDVYLVGFHPIKDHPQHQMEAHHYCKQVNEDFAQCALFDSNTADANFTGIEYIISEKLFNTLDNEEKKYWHPHNYEILSGQLVAPGLPAVAEKKLFEKKMNSYGKTIHTWRAKCWEGEKPFLDTLPKGEPTLAWSFNHDNEAKPELIEARDASMNIATAEKRQQRQDLIKCAKPQCGVTAIMNKFKGPLQAMPEVVDKENPQGLEVNQQPPLTRDICPG